MVTRARSISARLLAGGQAGDAAHASGRRIFANVGGQLAARVAMVAIGILTVAVMARSLGVQAYGTWTAAFAYVSVVGTFTELGLTNAALLGMSSEPEREGEWLGALMGLRGVLSVISAVVAAALIPVVLTGSQDVQKTALIIDVTLLTAAAGSLMTVYQSRVRMGMSVVITFAQNVLWTGAVLVLAATGGGVVGFALAWLGVSVVMAVLMVTAVRRHAHIAWRAGRALWRRMGRVALPIGISSVLIVIYFRLDSVLLYEIGGAHEAGIYGAAYRFLDPLLAVPSIVVGAFFPIMSALRSQGDEKVRSLVQTSADYLAVLSVPVLATTLVLSGPIVHFIYGPGFGATAGVLEILMAAFVSICFGTLAGFISPLFDLQWRLAAFSALGAAVNVVMNVVLIPPYGAYGSAWATLATELLTMTLMMTTTLRALHMRPKVGRLVRTVAAAAVMAGVMLLVRPLGLAPALVLGGLTYAGALLALGVVSLSELRSLRAGRAAAAQPAPSVSER